LAVLATRRFHNWEGSDEIHGVYVDACLTRGHRLFRAKDYAGARAAYEAALLYPENLEVGRPYRDYRAGEKHYFIGLAREALGDGAAARACFEKAAAHALEGASEARYHQACALRKLGRDEEAGRIFAGLAAHGAKEIAGAGAVDYFAKFGERRSERARIAQAHYLLGLGYRGQGREDEAVKEFRAALELAPDLLGARTQLAP
ncbi:MAG: tetratricopeptide repeat protein, partial [Planctomycetes bacterium]|nr:tetratricopeptide repeat protein [Planctomycetota bacterium]